MGAPRKYPDEVRDRAVRLVRDLVESEDSTETVTCACRRIGEQLGINTDTLRNWVKQVLVDDGDAVVKVRQTRRQSGSHAAAAHDHDVHRGSSPSAGPSATAGTNPRRTCKHAPDRARAVDDRPH